MKTGLLNRVRCCEGFMKRSSKARSESMRPSPSAPPGIDKLQPSSPEHSLLSAYMAEIGRKGGLKGGKARAAKLSARARKRIAVKAAESRWSASRKPGSQT
jgi:hypothetical protein